MRKDLKATGLKKLAHKDGTPIENAKAVVFAYGFERAGFPVSIGDVDRDSFRVRFVEFRNGQALHKANGLVMPSDICQELGVGKSGITYDGHLYARRMKEIVTLLERGGCSPCNSLEALTRPILDEK